MNYESVLSMLPHRYPFLMIDAILEIDPGKKVRCMKNVSMSDWYFQGHYPDHPIMPAMLIVEAMAQTGGLLAVEDEAGSDHLIAYFTSLDRARFRQPVRPGDQVIIEAESMRKRRTSLKFKARAFVGTKLVAEAELVVGVRRV